MRSFTIMVAAAAAGFALAPLGASAAGGEVLEYKHNDWQFKGPFGTYDAEAMQRGFQVYKSVCAGCHALDQLSFRNLGDKGGPFYLEACPAGVPETTNCRNPAENPVVKTIAAEYTVQDGPDDLGEMFDRPALPSDKFPKPFANEQQARAANGGAYPPNLALIVKARHHGSDYIYSLLTGYVEPPDTVTLGPGQNYNPYYAGDMSQLLKPEYLDAEGHPLEGVEIPPGGVFGMIAPLSDGIIDYADPAIPETVDQYAKDVVEFLTWASEPKMEERKSLGVITIGYLLILTIVLFFSYRAIWSKVDH
ncbi:MAG: cytochrome c1 [Parvularculaceae bacterium]|nr:cytochrome c1 [Parvularculaceae bacterium]